MTEQKKTEIPAGAKKPTDRQPKAEDIPESTTVEVMGVEVTINMRVFNDFRFVRSLRKLQKNDIFQLSDLLEYMVGDEKVDEVLEKLGDPDTGEVDPLKAIEFFTEAMELVNPNS